MKRLIWLSATYVTLFVTPVFADKVHLTNGRTLEGAVISRSATDVLLRTKCATVTVSNSEIQSIEKEDTESAAVDESSARLPRWVRFLDVAVAQPWLAGIHQIPATVVTEGSLGNVPYKSFRAGSYELNLYGDPEQPACLEIGFYGSVPSRDRAKSNCLQVMSKVLSNAQDRALLAHLDLTKDLKSQDGLTFEITPSTAADANGGWWISVYDPTAVQSARASPHEMRVITVHKTDVAKSASVPLDEMSWNTSDLAFARPTRGEQSAGASIGGGSVYVRGYTRKDGTYVHAHTRSAPGSGGRR